MINNKLTISNDDWLEDLEQLKNELPKRHKNLFFNMTLHEFESSIDNLKDKIHQYNFAKASTEIASIVAKANDSHTTVTLPVVNALPCEFYWFKEGIYIIGASFEYEKAINCKVIAIDNVVIEDVIKKLSRIISHENQSFLMSMLPRYLKAVEILYGLEIMNNCENVVLELEALDGKRFFETLQTFSYSTKNAELSRQINSKMKIPTKNSFKEKNIECENVIKNETMSETPIIVKNKTMSQVTTTEPSTTDKNNTNNKPDREIVILSSIKTDCQIPLYRQNSEYVFWSAYLEKQQVLYFKYNFCKNAKEISVKEYTELLLDFLNEAPAKKLVIDLRNNLGGDSTLLDPFIEKIEGIKSLKTDMNVFVIIGRDTFSSALLNAFSLKEISNCLIVGEASGGKPNCYGEVLYFDLKNSKLKIRYSTQYYNLIDDDLAESLFPDVEFEVSFKDYLENKDPCMEYILSL